MGQLLQFPGQFNPNRKMNKPINRKQQRIAEDICHVVQGLAEAAGSQRISVNTMQLAMDMYFKKHGITQRPSK